MFRGRRRGSLKRALDRAGDEELNALQAQIDERKERVAQLEFEIADTRANLARFERELEVRLGPLHARIDQLEADLEQARRRHERRVQWGDRVDDEEPPVDVVEQFRKTWTPRPKPPAAPKPVVIDENTLAELKSLFRSLAKRFHPDLVTDATEKKYRVNLMARVNAAYAAQDLQQLMELAKEPDRPAPVIEKTREQILADMAAEVARLDHVIGDLATTLRDLTLSHAVQLMLEASIATQSGRDLLEDMAQELEAQIRQLEVDLASYR